MCHIYAIVAVIEWIPVGSPRIHTRSGMSTLPRTALSGQAAQLSDLVGRVGIISGVRAYHTFNIHHTTHTILVYFISNRFIIDCAITIEE